jgi:UDP-N-acetylglucosamine--dolichyl-phosphate N-acetylglucosaminephosphotransferase
MGIDQQKHDKPRIPSAGGIPVVFGFFLGMMTFVALDSFILSSGLRLALLLAAVISCFAIALVGFFDDLHVRKKMGVNASGAVEYRVGLPQWIKPLLTLVGAVPLMAVEAGRTAVSLPIIGPIDVGLLYPLVLVPIAVAFVSNASNMLAGYNGLEAGMLCVAIAGIGAWSILHGNAAGAVVAFVGFGCILAFWLYNRYPATILPGDSFTYFAGAVLVSATILGGVEKFAAIAFLPWIIEFFLKLRGRFAVRSYGNLRADGSIEAPYDKVYSLPHLVIKACEGLGFRIGEADIVNVLIVTELAFLILASALAGISI